ncbi:alpha/beta hydrolase [Pigmentiphaga litoralis]|uniref:alpha/beta hydrolase n=1 Tax=Pigmentiphaga litoralis TaxID=516702 RepID=UPI003B438BE6
MAATGAPAAGGYPVLYLLDGNAAFDSLRQARAQVGAARAAPVVLVGVGYDVDDRYDVQARSMDYTPPSPGADTPRGVPGSPTAPGRAQPGGGADRMLAWMDGTLRPLIAQRYPVAKDRQGIYGHSFGALLVLHALFTDPGRYQTYVAASPSTWWNDRAIVKEARAFAEGASASGRPARLFVLAGGKELDGVMAEDSPEAIARRVNASGSTRVDKLTAGVQASYAHQPGKSHGEMLPIGLAYAIRWMALE